MIQGSFYVFYEVFTASFVINLIYFSGLPKTVPDSLSGFYDPRWKVPGLFLKYPQLLACALHNIGILIDIRKRKLHFTGLPDAKEIPGSA